MTQGLSSSTSCEDIQTATLARTRPKTSHGRSYIAGGYYFYDDYRNLTYYIRSGWVPYSERSENEGRMPKTLNPINYKGPAVFYAYFHEKDNSVYAINYIDQIASELFVGKKPDPYEFKNLIKKYQPFTLDDLRKKETEKRKSMSMPHLGKEQNEIYSTPTKKYSVVENVKIQTNPANFVIRRKTSDMNSSGYPDENNSITSTPSLKYSTSDLTVNSSHLNPLFGKPRQFDETSVETNYETGYESGDSEVFRCIRTPDLPADHTKRSPTFRQIYVPHKVAMPSNYAKSKSEELYSTLESISEDPVDEEKGPTSTLVSTYAENMRVMSSVTTSNYSKKRWTETNWRNPMLVFPAVLIFGIFLEIYFKLLYFE